MNSAARSSSRFAWGLLVPPFVSLLIAGGVVRYQSVRNARITAELENGQQEIARLARLLPKGRSVQMIDPDHCDGKHDH